MEHKIGNSYRYTNSKGFASKVTLLKKVEAILIYEINERLSPDDPDKNAKGTLILNTRSLDPGTVVPWDNSEQLNTEEGKAA